MRQKFFVGPKHAWGSCANRSPRSRRLGLHSCQQQEQRKRLGLL